jgi:hypothetical protein
MFSYLTGSALTYVYVLIDFIRLCVSFSHAVGNLRRGETCSFKGMTPLEGQNLAFSRSPCRSNKHVVQAEIGRNG